MMKRAILTAALVLAAGTPAAADEAPAPLFADDSPLEITIAGPIRLIERTSARSTAPHEATLTAGGETLPIMLSARGLSRRNPDNCQFPPLMVDLQDKPGDASLFRKQNRLKLVTHCRDQASFQRFALREFAVYRLYNALTPQSLMVRLLRVHYVDGGKEVAVRWGFFIEDIDDAAKRMGGKEIDVESVPFAALDPADEARVAMFRYMIGDLDWDMAQGPAGTNCCHNSKLVGADKEARSALIPVPYDFDYSGMVNTPYAVPPEGIPINSVRRRWYRGLCRDNTQAQGQAAAFIAARPQLEGVLRGIAQLDDRDRDDLLKYLDDFYDDIATPELVQQKLLKTCR
jgi:hypothetical protein